MPSTQSQHTAEKPEGVPRDAGNAEIKARQRTSDDSRQAAGVALNPVHLEGSPGA